MRKHGFLFAVTAALAVMMCGCENVNSVTPAADSGESKEQTSSDAPYLTVVPNSNSSDFFSTESSKIENNPSISSSSIVHTGSEITSQFELPNGDKADLTNAVALKYSLEGKRDKMPISQITDHDPQFDNSRNWSAVECAYVYLANPIGLSYNSIDNAGNFDANKSKFINIPETVFHNYKRYNVGDKFGELTVKKAMTEFNPEQENRPINYYNGGVVQFEGQITLTGWCTLSARTYGTTSAGDIRFIPDTKSNKIPVMNYSWDENEPLRLLNENNFYWIDENGFGFINLGNPQDYMNIDSCALLNSREFVKVKVTIEDIYCCNLLTNMNGCSAKLVNLELQE